MTSTIIHTRTHTHCTHACGQLSAGLVGATTFHFWRAGCLVALNTAGHSLLALLSLRALAAISTSTTTTSPAAESTTAVGERPSPGPVPVPVRGGGGEGGGVRLVVWAASASRLAPVLGSMGAALLLRRHLMLWAVFAPKVRQQWRRVCGWGRVLVVFLLYVLAWVCESVSEDVWL